MLEIDSELKNKWVEALRSGDYKQGKLCLRTEDNCFCCLGVLCDLIDKEGWKKQNSNFKFIYEDKSSYDFLPNSIKLTDDEYIQHTLVEMNDNKNKNFSEIADYIQENI